MKSCKDWKTPKELSEFPKNGNSFRSRCKICHSDYKKALKNDKVLKDKAIRIEQMGSLAECLAQKVKQFDTMVINHPHKSFLKWEHIKSIDDHILNFFTDKEIKALSTIGQPLHCIELQRSISGRDYLCERL